MVIGVLFALVAGMLWGLVFVGPLLLPDYPAALQSFGRYLAFGLISLPMVWLDRRELWRLTRADWLDATALALIGNLVYYLCLSGAILHAGGPLPTMIIGTLPLTVAVCANLHNARRDGRLPWRKLVPSLLLIAAGIACVNRVEQAERALAPGAGGNDYLLGIVLALGALACWTWYPLKNADWLRRHAGRRPRAWATAQGLATLPLALAGYLGWCGWAAASGAGFALPFGPRPAVFVGLMLTIGLCASWLGTLCWNEASQRLPTALVGQLIVFETLSALAYTFVLRGAWPQPLALAGIALLVLGVYRGVRIRPARAEPAAAGRS